MSKNPGKVGFDQPNHGQGGTTTAKNKGKLGFKQPAPKAGKTSAKKNPGNVPFTQKTAKNTPSSTKKNAGQASFSQPAKGGSAPMPKSSNSGKAVQAKAGKVKGNPKVGPKIKSVADIEKFRKGKYGA